MYYYTVINAYKGRRGKGKGCQATRFFLAQLGAGISINIAISFSTSALDRVCGQRHTPSSITLGKVTSDPFYTTLVGPHYRTRRVRKILHAMVSNSEAYSR